MSKIKSITQLQDVLDTEYSWRLQEIANLKTAVRSSRDLGKFTIIRASVPSLYAHWEGFIKNSATSYLEFVNGQNLKYCELQTCFIVFGVKKHINDLVASGQSATSIGALEFIRKELNNKARLKIESAIRTESNLGWGVFKNIATSIGVSVDAYESKENLIDKSLLHRRNCIAHGEYLDLGQDEFRELADEVLGLMRSFKTDIENSASMQAFRIAS